jgi:hypothetical protein
MHLCVYNALYKKTLLSGLLISLWTVERIRLKEGNAKCRHLTKFTCKGTLRQVFICLRPRTPQPPPFLHAVECVHCTLYIHTGKGGGES